MNYTEGMLREGSLKGKNILITGGGTGLGRAMGEYFLELGANLVITSRKLEVLEETAKEMMAKSGGKVKSCGPSASLLLGKSTGS
jgi:NAD(P)-dependent dehydrogenase (short-subunit alcohol dehydrogenase family)